MQHIYIYDALAEMAFAADDFLKRLVSEMISGSMMSFNQPLRKLDSRSKIITEAFCKYFRPLSN